MLEAVTDADNVGSAFRNAAAFGASVVLSEACCDPLYRKAIRTSMGSVLRTPYARSPRLAARPGHVEERGVHARGIDAARRRDRSSGVRETAVGEQRLRCSSAAKGRDCRRKPKRWRTSASAFRSAPRSIR